VHFQVVKNKKKAGVLTYKIPIHPIVIVCATPAIFLSTPMIHQGRGVAITPLQFFSR
jgi:hypothetical protein